VFFNGAIYNFPELRAELEQRGHRFHTKPIPSSVEGYLAWGIGRSARAPARHVRVCALGQSQRDSVSGPRPPGRKALLYFEDGNALVFASTAAALRASGCVDELDDRAVVDFLEFGFVTDRRAIFHGAHKLAPAISSNGEWRVPRARLLVAARCRSRSRPELEDRFEEAVEQTQRLLSMP